MVKKVDSEGVSLFCDNENCGKRIDKDNSYTWLVNGKPANRRFCSAKCLYTYETGYKIIEEEEEA